MDDLVTLKGPSTFEDFRGNDESGYFGKSSVSEPKITVVYVTCGRAEIVCKAVNALRVQTHRPHEIIVSATQPLDVGALIHQSDLKIVFGPKGCCLQRNTALRSSDPSTDFVVFLDDDFVCHPSWLEAVAECFRERPDVTAVTGQLLADGVCQGGLAFEKAAWLIDRYRGEFRGRIWEDYSPYGCNMAFRRSAISGLLFDERLVLYGWQEDRDFGAALAARGGKQIKIGDAVGVHLGVNRGRTSGRSFGYSQIVNPLYLYRKRHMTIFQLLSHMGRNVGMNVMRSFFPELHIDRLGRLIGNLRGFFDVSRGILMPERAADLG